METTEIKSNVEDLRLYSDNYPFNLSLRISNFDSESDYKKFIRNCEMLIRRCGEYKLWRNYIKDVLQVDECMITHEKNSEVTIDVHHHIPSLFVLVSALVNRNIETNAEFCTFDLCKEIIELHFQNKIGYVTLLKSMHEKFHNGRLSIPVDLVKGDYRSFMNTFSKYLDEADLESMEERMVCKDTNSYSWSRDNYPISMEA
jgi:hypothetical protein